MIFSVTERGSFQRCKRKAALTSKNGLHLTPLFNPLHLDVGSITHRAGQLWLLDPKTSLEHHTLTAANEAQDRTIKNYIAAVGVPPSDAELLTTHEAIDICLSMAQNYQVKYGVPIPDDYTLIAPEQKVSLLVPGTEHPCPNCIAPGTGRPLGFVLAAGGKSTEPCPMCNGTKVALHCLQGRLDALLMHRSGRPAVLERKTYGSRPKQETLQTSDQFIAYIWMLQQLKINNELPNLLYDGMWRRASIPKGRTFDDLFTRFVITRSPAELKEFSFFLPLELNDMARVYATPEAAYINRRWEGCFDCGVRELCYALSRGEDTAELIRTKFTVRTDDVDESEEEDAGTAAA